MYVVLTAPIHFFFSKFGLQFFDPCHKVQSFLRVPDRNELLDLNYVRHVDYVIMPFPDSQLESLLENIKKWELLPPSDGLITTTQLIFLCPCSNKFAFKTEFIILKMVYTCRRIQTIRFHLSVTAAVSVASCNCSVLRSVAASESVLVNAI